MSTSKDNNDWLARIRLPVLLILPTFVILIIFSYNGVSVNRIRSMDEHDEMMTRASFCASEGNQSSHDARYLFSEWNEEAFLSLRKKVEKYFKLSKSIIIYDPEVKFVNMSFTLRPSKLDRTHGITPQCTCAVIGSSGLLLNSSCGKEIDSHDFVLRTNLPFIRGFENDVGEKQNITTVNAMGAEILANELLVYMNRTFNGEQRPTNETEDEKKGRLALQRLKDLKRAILWQPKMGTREFKVVINASQEMGLKFQVAYTTTSTVRASSRVWRTSAPSTGLILFTAAVTFCDKISLYGFYPFHTDRYNNTIKYHYYEDVEFNFDTNVHKMPNEFLKLTELHKKGAIRHVTDRCEH
ncbi:CMP-N-acetylneuraminate-poly-alpha-2,8-sialyltransferase-like [Amphiura filiformis]|uniref:CMP-N-acetylneuraminate-poly-alpha-2, 8-sialyltransferase-like n=1 Tax=Amphiura filiformis TaxID=82378 RepID=UPI003B220921